MSTAVSIDELQRAWSAVEAGEFRIGGSHRRRRTTAAAWTPTEPVVVVAGATGRVGASTVAAAMATAAGRHKVRIIECGPMHATGLAAATTAELGVTSTGWRQGMRDQILIERTTGSFVNIADVPTPEPADVDTTLVDVTWDLAQIAGTDSWLGAIAETAPLVIVTAATVPGLRALDNALRLKARPGDTWCVVTGPRMKKWPKPLRLATTTAIDAASTSGRLLTVPEVQSIALTGLTPDPLPPQLVSACSQIFDQTVEHAKGNRHAPL